MLSIYDYIVIGVYFLFMIVIGSIFRRMNRNISDYFRGGGRILWWIVGGTAFMGQFSAWTFTGAASKAYDNGILILSLYFGNALAYFANFLFTAHRIRRMRIVTSLEGIRHRWNMRNEQFFTWVQVPMGIIYSGIALSGLSVILASVFGLEMNTTVLVAGAIMVFVATLGGSFAATAGDFMQMLVLLAVTCVAAFLALRQIGGVGGFMAHLPDHSLLWGNLSRSKILWLWVIAVIVKGVTLINNMSDGYRYLIAKDDRHARRGALLTSILFIVGPVIWFIPPMVARMLYPHLNSIPALQPLGNKIHDGAYLAMAITTMPVGMIGLMITSLFAATISNTDTGLNKNTGIFIGSFYGPILRPRASRRELLIASKVTTAAFGTMIILSALLFDHLQNLSLFNLMQEFTAMIALPIAIPLVWGLFFKRTPAWSGWSTVVVCFLTSLLIGNLTTWFGRDAYIRVLGLQTPLTGEESPDVVFLLSVFANLVVGTIWFFGSTFWYVRQPAKYHEQVNAFFERMRMPVNFAKEHGESADHIQLQTLGSLCMAYGAFVLLLLLIPNTELGRGCFLFVGGMVGGIGVLLFWASRRQASRSQQLNRQSIETP